MPKCLICFEERKQFHKTHCDVQICHVCGGKPDQLKLDAFVDMAHEKCQYCPKLVDPTFFLGSPQGLSNLYAAQHMKFGTWKRANQVIRNEQNITDNDIRWQGGVICPRCGDYHGQWNAEGQCDMVTCHRCGLFFNLLFWHALDSKERFLNDFLRECHGGLTAALRATAGWELLQFGRFEADLVAAGTALEKMKILDKLGPNFSELKEHFRRAYIADEADALHLPAAAAAAASASASSSLRPPSPTVSSSNKPQ